MDDLQQHQFKYYPVSMGLSEVSYAMRALTSERRDAVSTLSAKTEMKSQARADARGITRWQSYVRAEECTKPRHFARCSFVKTAEVGWIHTCCALELGYARLPDTYVEPTPEAIEATYDERESELKLIHSYRQRASTAKTVATKKAMAEAAALRPPTPKALAKAAAKETALQEKIDLKAEVLVLKAQTRVDRLSLNRLARELTMSPTQVIISRQKAASKARCKARKEVSTS